MTTHPEGKVRKTIDRISSDFPEFTVAFNKGQYVLWLGSGISRDRVPNVNELIERVLEYLRSNIVDSDPECEYRSGLNQVLDLAALDSTERANIDFSVPVERWPLKFRIIPALVTNYSQVLDVDMGDRHPEDYLVWNGLDVPNTYGRPGIEPDVEHYAIAILMLEGVVDSAVTANWDGLLEVALSELSSAFKSQVRVAIKPDDFRNSGAPIDVIKFHGCAVRAREDESEYRNLLIARESQISSWTTRPEHKSMLTHLEILYTNRPTLMIGLSAQDANLHTVFASAFQTLSRTWPSSPPAVVLSEEQIRPYHRNLLKLTYGQDYQANSAAISKASLLGSFGKPTLLSLVLISLTNKFIFLLEQNPDNFLSQATVDALKKDLLNLRDFIASNADPENHMTLDSSRIAAFQRIFIRRFIDVLNLALSIFRTGRLDTASRRCYTPLSDRPVDKAILNADFPAKPFGRISVALALIGRGVVSGHWSITAGNSKALGEGVIRLATRARAARVFLVKDAASLTNLQIDGFIDENDDDVLVVVAEKEPPAMTRSPRSHFGRVGAKSIGRFNVAESVSETDSADELFEAFNLTGGF